MRGIRTWTSARSTERCSRMSSLTLSATPTRTIVAGTTRSERALIVSANSTRPSVVDAVELVEEDRERLATRKLLKRLA